MTGDWRSHGYKFEVVKQVKQLITLIIFQRIIFNNHASLWGRVSLVARESDSKVEKVGSIPACALKQGTLSYLFRLWTEM